MQIDDNTKRLIRYCVIIFGILLLIGGIVWFFSNSWLTIKTPSSTAEISILQDGVVVKTLKGQSVFTSVAPGSYTVSVTDGEKMSTKYIVAPGGQFHTYTYALKEISQAKDITSVRANSLFANETSLRYVDMGDEASGYISVSQNSISRLSSDLRFSQIAWNSSGQGFGLSSTLGTEETSMGIAAISGDKAVNYPLPSDTENTGQSVAISPNGTGWFAGGNNLYQQTGTGLTRVYQAKQAITVLAATNNNALVVESTSSNGDSVTMQLVSVKPDGSETRGASFAFHADPNLSLGATYSPDGSHFVLTSLGTGIIYTNDLKETGRLPLDTMVTSAIWRDNSTILYAATNSILSYSLDAKTADVVGKSEPGSTITNLAYSPTNDSLVMSVTGSSSSDTIKQVNLKVQGTQPTSAEQALIAYLPREYTMLSCMANYNTFSGPTVVIEQRVSFDNEQNARDCETAVKQTFDQYNIDPAQFTYKQLLP